MDFHSRFTQISNELINKPLLIDNKQLVMELLMYILSHSYAPFVLYV